MTFWGWRFFFLRSSIASYVRLCGMHKNFAFFSHELHSPPFMDWDMGERNNKSTLAFACVDVLVFHCAGKRILAICQKNFPTLSSARRCKERGREMSVGRLRSSRKTRDGCPAYPPPISPSLKVIIVAGQLLHARSRARFHKIAFEQFPIAIGVSPFSFQAKFTQFWTFFGRKLTRTFL